MGTFNVNFYNEKQKTENTSGFKKFLMSRTPKQEIEVAIY